MFARHSPITFDVGRSCMRACQLSAQRGRVSLRDKMRLELPAEVVAAANSAEPARGQPQPAGGQQIDCERVARLAAQGGFLGGDVALVLSPPDVRFHAAKLAETVLHQAEDRIRAAVAFEAAREARCEPGELEVRWWRLPAGNQQGLNVMTLSLSTQRAVQWSAALEARKLFLRRIDAAPCAVVRAACESWTPGERDMWAVLDLGFRQSVLTVVIGRTVAYVRVLTTGADSWTRCLASGFEAEYGEAEAIKRQHGIAPGTAAEVVEPASSERDLPRAVFDLLRDRIDALVREIDLCCSYVVQTYSDVEMRRLVLTGGGSALNGLSDFVALHLGVPVYRLGYDAAIDPSEPIRRGAVRLATPELLGLDFGAEYAAALGSAILDLEAA